MKRILFISIFLILSKISAQALPDSVKVFLFEVRQDIGPESWRNTKNAFRDAQLQKADLMLIHLNTYGGMVNAADSMRTKILNAPIPVWVFIDNNAASAGALISIACDKVYMRPGGNIGAATVVDQSGQPVPDKYQSFMRSMMRSTAESHGYDTIVEPNGDTIFKWKRDPKIAEAMVDPKIYVEGVSDSGQVVSFTTNEALLHGFADGKAESLVEMLEKEKVKNYTIIRQKLTWTDKLINFLINPFVHGILIMVIVGGIYFELQSPGVGFPLAAAIIATLLYFAPLYVEGIAENWEILIFIAGLILIVVEVFVIPGFGVAGISGLLLIVVGLTLAMVDNLEFQLNPNYVDTLLQAMAIVVIASFASFVASIWLSKKLFGGGRVGGLALSTTQKTEDGYANVDEHFKSMVGKVAIAHTMLRPSGTVRIENEYFDAMAQTGFIEKGAQVRVIRTSAAQLYVEPVEFE